MTRYIGLAEYLWLAEQVTGIEAPVLAKAGRMDLADSALHAPQGAFGGVEFYPDLIDKTAGQVAVRMRDPVGVIPRPTLLAAVVSKAAALRTPSALATSPRCPVP